MRFIPRTPEYLELRRKRRIAARRKWLLNNKEAMDCARNRWREKNHDRILNNRRLRTKRLTGRTVIPRGSISEQDKISRARKRSSRWYHNHKSGPQLLLRHRLRTRVLMSLGKKHAKKSSKTIELIGCTWEFLEWHIEQQFAHGMTWENRGLWHVDHIRPCSSYDLTNPEQQKRCFHYSNLRPLWAKDNLSKGHKWK